MIRWIKKNKIPSAFVAFLIVIVFIWGISSGLGYMSAKRYEFIERIKQGAIEGYEQYGVLPSLCIAQACHESAYGSSHIDHNLFGIKAGSSWKGKVAIRRTHEYVNGKKIYIDAKFRAYDSFNDSVVDYVKLLASNKRYSKVVNATDYKTAAYEISVSGYCTDPNYYIYILKIMNTYKLYLIDEEAKEIIEQKKIEEEQLIEIQKQLFYKRYRWNLPE